MELVEQPYRHYLKENFFSQKQFQMLCEFAEKSEWFFFEDENFPQYIIRRNQIEYFFLNNEDSKEGFSYLFSAEFISGLEILFQQSLEKCAAISFHKLTKTNFNIVHNDFNSNGEKLRIVCYLSTPESYEGGELNLYLMEQLDNPFRSYKLKANTAFVFEMNQQSFHSVSEVKSGDRICLVITYQ